MVTTVREVVIGAFRSSSMDMRGTYLWNGYMRIPEFVSLSLASYELGYWDRGEGRDF